MCRHMQACKRSRKKSVSMCGRSDRLPDIVAPYTTFLQGCGHVQTFSVPTFAKAWLWFMPKNKLSPVCPEKEAPFEGDEDASGLDDSGFPDDGTDLPIDLDMDNQLHDLLHLPAWEPALVGTRSRSLEGGVHACVITRPGQLPYERQVFQRSGKS